MSEAKRSPNAAGESLPAYREAKANALATFHRRYFRTLMDHHDSLTSAAEAAGMDRKHLRSLLRRFGLWTS